MDIFESKHRFILNFRSKCCWFWRRTNLPRDSFIFVTKKAFFSPTINRSTCSSVHHPHDTLCPPENNSVLISNAEQVRLKKKPIGSDRKCITSKFIYCGYTNENKKLRAKPFSACLSLYKSFVFFSIQYWNVLEKNETKRS